MLRSVLASLTGLAMLVSAMPASATDIDIACGVKGQKQGDFQTNRGVGGDPKQIPVLFLSEEITVPIDPNSGLPTGRHKTFPVTLVKGLDPSSIQFFIAAATNENLDSVKCTFFRDRGEGVARAYFRIALTNAHIIDYKDAGDGGNGDGRGDEREHISLTYQKIELDDLESRTSAEDDWTIGL
jgi:type VI secretion system secreted protein Hcp